MRARASILDRVGPVDGAGERGAFRLYAFRCYESGTITESLAYVVGEVRPHVTTPVRINSACITSEVFGDRRCDCAWQLDQALDLVHERGLGIITYHPSQEGRGVGLLDKLLTYSATTHAGLSSAESFAALGLVADQRQYGSAVAILAELGAYQIELLSNSPSKHDALEQGGFLVAATTRLVNQDPMLQSYLASKARSFGHDIRAVPAVAP